MDKNGGPVRLWSRGSTGRARHARMMRDGQQPTRGKRRRGKNAENGDGQQPAHVARRVVIMGMGMGRNVEQNRAEVARHGHGSMYKEQACQEHDKSSPRHDGQRVASKKLGPIDWHRTA